MRPPLVSPISSPARPALAEGDGRMLPAHLAFLRERLRPAPSRAGVWAFGDARVDGCFPPQGEQRGLPLGALHEIGAEGLGAETGEVSAAFAGALIGGICARQRGRSPVLWVASVADLYPPGLAGLDPARLVLANPRDDAGVLAAMELALREGGFAAVVGEVGAWERVASRRLAFACQKHGITAFALRRWPHGNRRTDREASAAATRWRVAPAPDGRWRVELAHARGGRGGSWVMEVGDGIDPSRAKGATHPLRVVAALADHAAAADAPTRQAAGYG